MSASAGRVLIILKGEYNSAAQYQMLDAVRYNGSLYIAKKATSGNTPQDGEYWMLCATGAEWGDISGNIANQTDLQNALSAKQDTLTFDSTPTASSSNPVTSGGIKTALDAKMSNPSGGVTGDVLVKTATGVDWDTLSASDVALGTGTMEDLAGSVATIELSPTLNTYAIGDFLLWNGVLYTVTAPIDAGENLVVGTNISARTIGSELTALNNDLTNLNEVKTHQITGLDKVFHFYKIGRVVWMDAPYDLTTASAGVNNVGTAPDWLRPMRLVRFPIANAPTRGFFQIETNGAMSLYQSSAVTSSTNCAISGCYIAAE